MECLYGKTTNTRRKFNDRIDLQRKRTNPFTYCFVKSLLFAIYYCILMKKFENYFYYWIKGDNFFLLFFHIIWFKIKNLAAKHFISTDLKVFYWSWQTICDIKKAGSLNCSKVICHKIRKIQLSWDNQVKNHWWSTITQRSQL